MRPRLFIVAIALLSGCGGRLTEETIRHHPRLNLETLRPQVVEASGPLRPAWIERTDRGAVAFVPFTGQAMAPTLEAAKAQAERDLRASVSSFISVDVSSSFESRESFTSKDGKASSSIDVNEVVRSQTSAQLKEVKVDELYWEKVQTSPLLPDATQYRYFAFARVPKAEILRARLQKQTQRQQGSGRRVLVVLPFRGPADTAAIQSGLVEELSRRLLVLPTLQVSDPELVRSLVGGERGQSESAALETIGDALMPDFVVAGSYQIHQGRVRISYTIHGPSGVVDGGTIEDEVARLYSVEDRLLEALSAKLGAAKSEVTPSPAHRPGAGARSAYAEAGSLYQAGNNEAAVAALQKALVEDPSFGRAYLRLGRVLERMGRYGDLDPAPPVSIGGLDLCLSWKRITDQDPRHYLEALTRADHAPAPPLGERIPDILSAARYGVTPDYVPKPGVGPMPASAAGAYWHAYRLAVLAEDPLLVLEAQIALGDLALRVDQLEAGGELYERGLAEADRLGLHHYRNLAKLGLGKVLKERGLLEQAARWLEETLAERRRLGEKPFVLEVLNELGAIAVDLGQYAAARTLYEEALRLAEDLDNEYLIAVLGNNLGVLEATLGQTVRAEDRFTHALAELTDLGEADGRIASGLNAGLIAAKEGDLEAAGQRYRDALRIVTETGQLGREAQVLFHEGHKSAMAGQTEPALRALVRSWSIYAHLGRTRDRLRVENELVVLGIADLGRRRLTGHERAIQLSCLAARADQITSEWGVGHGGYPYLALAPFAAWSSSVWLRSMADHDGYHSDQYESVYDGRGPWARGGRR